MREYTEQALGCASNLYAQCPSTPRDSKDIYDADAALHA
jgi:hypothetical protein